MLAPPMARQLSTRGMRWTLLGGVFLALLLPMRVECGYPGATACGHKEALGLYCSPYQLEPWGIYAMERYVLHRDFGFAYQRGEECR